MTRESMVSGTAKLINLLEAKICSCYSFLKETNPISQSNMILLFYYLMLQQNDALVTSLCMQLYFSGEGGKYHCDERALPVPKKGGVDKVKIHLSSDEEFIISY